MECTMGTLIMALHMEEEEEEGRMESTTRIDVGKKERKKRGNVLYYN